MEVSEQARVERRGQEPARDDVLRDIHEPEVVVAGVATQRSEGLFHVEPESLGDHPLGLLDDDAAVERVGELLVEDLRFERGSVRRIAMVATSASA